MQLVDQVCLRGQAHVRVWWMRVWVCVWVCLFVDVGIECVLLAERVLVMTFDMFKWTDFGQI